MSQGLELCPSCQAPHAPEEAFCWMCHHKFWRAPSGEAVPDAAGHDGLSPVDPVPQPAAAPVASEKAASDSRWTQPVLVGAFVLVLIGLTGGKGVAGLLLGVGQVIALFILAMQGFKKPAEKPQGFWPRFQRGVTVLASTLALMLLVAMALCIAGFMACLAIMGMMGMKP